MPDLNWTTFENLPGAATSNWQLLCRELVRRNFARHGKFRSLAQQPGVEFHLDLDTDCSLGDCKRYWGWQCRWYGLSAGQPIGTTRRKKIEGALRTTEKHVPELTDWVLWTRRPLTPTDQKWFYAISTKFKLSLWTEEEVLGLLTGEAEVLRATYFGELVLTPEKLQQMHAVATAPIKKRWEPLLHVEVDVERDLKAAIGTPGTWPILRETSDRMLIRASTLHSDCEGLRSDELALVKSTADTLINQSKHLLSLADALDGASMADVRGGLENPAVPPIRKHDLQRIAARLRSVKHPASLSLAASNWELSNYGEVLGRLSDTLEQKFFAVVGDAGFGKTYLAAELTKPSDKSPGGILLLAKHLAKNGSLDSIACRLPFGGDRMEQLLEAADAAGARANRRIPIVIDGLNESENPPDWKGLLETLNVQLSRTSNCVVIVTLRSANVDRILPSNTTTTYLTGFEHEPESAIQTYFKYYKIDATDAQLPWDQLSSPLFLSLFCQATNPNRKQTVGLDHIPRSLTAVFDKYREVVISRAADTLNMAHQDVESALEQVGLALWRENARALDFDTLRKIVGDHPRAWQDSLARVLEEEGVLSRDPYPRFTGFNSDGHPSGNQVSAILYDAFAGFVIADAILAQQGTVNFSQWISANWKQLSVSEREHHPFAEDILNGLVGLLPRRHHCQLWPIAPPQLREAALMEAANLEAKRIDKETCSELMDLCERTPAFARRNLFFRLRSTRASLHHPFNAEFLHKLLSRMDVAQRDLKWSEWLRRNRKEIHNDLEHLEQHWRATELRDERDKLFARWISWALTSTVRYLRDQATKSLYWYGIGATRSFFEMTIESLGVNDSYVTERMLAAAYGVVMGKQRTIDELKEPLLWFLGQITEQLSGADAIAPTNHWMSREYIRGILAFVENFIPTLRTSVMRSPDEGFTFRDAPYVQAEDVRDKYTGYLDMDFVNDEVGRLFPERSKYDNEHLGFNRAITEIKGRIWALGWREELFEQIDKEIAEDRYRTRDEPAAAEQYAIKYARIGAQECAGVLISTGPMCSGRTDQMAPIVDIDPSFPETPPALSITIASWVDFPSIDNKKWLGSGIVDIPNQLLRTSTIDNCEGPWIAVDGYMQMTNKLAARRVFGFVRAMLVSKKDVKGVVSLLKSQEYLGNSFIPNEPGDYYTFAGEIPWSDRFATGEGYDEELGPYKGQIGGYWTGGPIVEILSHRYGWESYHSSVNSAGDYSVPSKLFSKEFGLRSATSSFDQFDAKGKAAAISTSPPENCDQSGNMLYLREDLLVKYATARKAEIVWAAWGERNLTNIGLHPPDWSIAIYQRHGHIWRRVETYKSLTKGK